MSKRQESIEEKQIIKEQKIEKIIEKPIEKLKVIYRDFKRGTKSKHNPDLADPNIS